MTLTKTLLAFSLQLLIIPQISAKPTTVNLCEKNEKALFACKKNNRSYVLCASDELSKTSGHLKYKVRKLGKTEFEFPKSETHPAGKFFYHVLNRGAEVGFIHDGLTYTLSDGAMGNPDVLVEKDGNEISDTRCDGINESGNLSENSTATIMEKAGLKCETDLDSCLKK